MLRLISVTNASGTELASTNLGVQNSIRYRGYVYDTETGLYYLQSRYYDPETGRFLNADDVDYIGYSGEQLSYNAFAYCENNPIDLVDHNGKFAKWIYNKFKTFKNYIVGFGVQFECSGSGLGVTIGMGVEIIYFPHLKKVKLYGYSPRGFYFDSNDLSNLFSVAKNKLSSPKNLFKNAVSGSISISGVIIYSKKGKNFKSDDYLYDFKTYSFTLKNFQCFYSKGSDCVAVGAGGTISSSVVNISASTSYSYYQYADQFLKNVYDNFAKSFVTIKDYLKKAIVNRK